MKNYKGKKLTSILSATTIAALTLVGSVAPAFAAGTYQPNENAPETEKTGTTTSKSENATLNNNVVTFQKKVYLDNNQNMPKGDVSFKVEGVEPTVNSINGYKAEKGTTALTASTVSFGYDDTAVQDASNNYYVSKDVTINLATLLNNAQASNTTKTPTVYTYKITETTPTWLPTQTNNDNVRYLNVYVGLDKTNKNLEINGVTLAKAATTGTGDVKLNKEDTKTSDFKNKYVSHDLNITKEVTGNQGYYDQDFTFNVEVKNQHAKLTVSSENNQSSKDNTTITPKDDNTANFSVTLRHGQSVKINGLTEGATYSVTEDQTTAQGYTESATGDKGTISTETSTAAFINNREGTVPTGLYHNNRLAINIVGVALAGGVIAIAVKRKHDKAEDAE